MVVNEPEAVHQFVSSAKYLAALRRISRSSRSLAFSRSSTRMRSASDSPEAAVAESGSGGGVRRGDEAGDFLTVGIGFGACAEGIEPAAQRVAGDPEIGGDRVDRCSGSRLVQRDCVMLEPLGVGLAWHGGKVPHFPSDMLVSACPPPGGQVLEYMRVNEAIYIA